MERIMTPEQALQLLVLAAAISRLTKEEHIRVEQAAQILAAAIKPAGNPTVGEPHEGTPAS